MFRLQIAPLHNPYLSWRISLYRRLHTLPRSSVGQTPKTHKHRSTQISAHPSLITDPPLWSLAMHRRAPILTSSTRLSNALADLATTTNRRSGRASPILSHKQRLGKHERAIARKLIWPPPLHPLQSSFSLNLSPFLPPLTKFVNKRCFYFNFWLC